MKNSGLNPDVVWNKIEDSKGENSGYDARKEQVVDMFEAGIIDPAKVTKNALRNAVSAAGTLLTTNYAIIEE